MSIPKTHGIEISSGQRPVDLFRPHIRIHDKSPAQNSGILIQEHGKRPCRIESLCQPPFILGEKPRIIRRIGSPCAPAMRRRDHVRHHVHIVLSLPEPQSTSATAHIRNPQLCQTVMSREKRKHLPDIQSSERIRLCTAANIPHETICIRTGKFI